MAKLYHLLPIFALLSSTASAWDYSTSPCIPPADLGMQENTADYNSEASDTNKAIADSIKNSVTADLQLPLSNYSNAAPSISELHVGDVNVSNGEVSVNGVDVGSANTSTTPPPCVIELKPLEK